MLSKSPSFTWVKGYVSLNFSGPAAAASDNSSWSCPRTVRSSQAGPPLGAAGPPRLPNRLH